MLPTRIPLAQLVQLQQVGDQRSVSWATTARDGRSSEFSETRHEEAWRSLASSNLAHNKLKNSATQAATKAVGHPLTIDRYLLVNVAGIINKRKVFEREVGQQVNNRLRAEDAMSIELDP